MTLQILVVDDTVAMAEQYAYDLKRVGGYQTTIAGGGSEGLEILAREPIDCVILDLEMPGTDGFEYCAGCSRAALTHRSSSTPVPAATSAACRR